MATQKADSPIAIFQKAFARVDFFLAGGKDGKGPKAFNNQRAAVVFAVASVDAYFRAKVIEVLRSKRKASKAFALPITAQEHARSTLSKEVFRTTDYKSLSKKRKALVNIFLASNHPDTVRYVEQVTSAFSFQSIPQLDEGIKMMGAKPPEVWAKVNSQLRTKKRGNKPDYRNSLRALFERRHQIAHNADLHLSGTKYRGTEKPISYKYVDKWIRTVKRVIEAIEKQLF